MSEYINIFRFEDIELLSEKLQKKYLFYKGMIERFNAGFSSDAPHLLPGYRTMLEVEAEIFFAIQELNLRRVKAWVNLNAEDIFAINMKDIDNIYNERKRN